MVDKTSSIRKVLSWAMSGECPEDTQTWKIVYMFVKIAHREYGG
jgi:hypothetical protein